MGEKRVESAHVLAILTNEYGRKSKIRPIYSGVFGGQNTNRRMNDNTPGVNVQQKTNRHLSDRLLLWEDGTYFDEL